MKLMEQVREAIDTSGRRVFAEPYVKDGITVIPAAKVMGGGGGGEGTPEGGEPAAGGGLGFDARPAGAFVVKGDEVTWMPAFDANRAVAGIVALGIIALLSWRSVARAQTRRRR
jgi:uncharacterized spore protein YtfJ